MEKTVTFRFYDVTRTSADKPSFSDVLAIIAARPLPDRETRVSFEEILVRLEDYDSDNEYVWGQFIRGQTGNLPGQMLETGTTSLPFVEPLGHGVAFRYRMADGLLAIQYDPRVLSPSKVFEYLYAFEPRAEYFAEPRLRPDAIERFNELPIRKLDISVAGPPNIVDAENPDDSVWANIARMKRQYGADTVRFQVSMGHRGGNLLEVAKDVAREALRRHEANTDTIRTIKAVMETGEGAPNDEIDLMGELFDVREDLNFPDRDVAAFYRLRRDLLAARIRLL